jgi:N-acetylglutamate synthase-like GNAT family acetyltransferase
VRAADMMIRKLTVDEEPPMDLLLMADPSPKLVEEYIKRGECFVAESNGEIIGVYVLLPTKPGTVELVNIAVVEEQHGNGVGKELVMDAIKKAKARGIKTIEIGTGNSSIGQLALYQKCGFRMTGVDRDFFTRHYPEEIFENGIQCRDMIRLSQDL